MPRVMADTDVDDFVKRYRSGETLKQLMAAFNIGHGKAIAHLAAHGITPINQGERSRKLSAEQAKELVARYVAGEGTKQLGPAFGISSRGVSDYLRRAGVQARPSHHGIVKFTASQTHEERSAMTSTSMVKRWANATPEQRSAMLDPAHDASRGVPRSAETKHRIAKARDMRAGSDSAYEEQVAQWLDERGMPFIQQQSVGEYCADFAVGNVLVEVTTGWARKKEWGERFACFFDQGWHLYVIWHDTRIPLLPVVTDDLIAWVKILQSDPPARSEHRVIWRSRQIVSAGSDDADYVAGVLRSSTPRGHWPLYDSPRD